MPLPSAAPFTPEEIDQIEGRGSTVEQVRKQLTQFRNGVAPAQLVRPATQGDGIMAFKPDQIRSFATLYESKLTQYSVLKFVPASGAATRMFKEIHQFTETGERTETVQRFLSKIHHFAFYDHLKTLLDTGSKEIDDQDLCIKLLLENGLGYGRFPKGLLPFHKYANESRTPLHEQVVEGMEYARNADGKVLIHLTVSEEHLDKFGQQLEPPAWNDLTEGSEIEITFSTQKKSTDTIAVDENNVPFKDALGNMVFRPGGHGALIDNLNEQNADLVFIKNIDNVLHDDHKAETCLYKKALGGILIEYQSKIFSLLERLEEDSGNIDLLIEAQGLLTHELCIELPGGYDGWSLDQKRHFVVSKLNRPLRVCGMVLNAGERGGGPFWVKDGMDSMSLQIVETAQIDSNDAEQERVLGLSTHFNPVDIVCGMKDYRGEKFNLKDFVDAGSSFITSKSVGGKEIKALEHPGLWNGGMAGWNSIFVEVPMITFSPVKTITDLLKKEHRAMDND